jgi:Ca2+-binding RTX toxin-like protein
LLLGNLSGGGTLEIGVGANLWLTGSDNAALTADFAGGGTLTLAQPALAAAPMITGFGTGDAILLAVGGATGAFYTQTAPGLGVVSIDDGSQLLAQITLLGNEAGQAFSVSASPATGAAGGFTILTTEPVETTGPGGIFVTNPSTSGGTSMTLDALVASLQPVMPYATPALSAFAPLNSEIYDWFSVDGTPPPGNVSGLAGVEVVGPLPSQTGGGGGPGVAIAMQPGFGAVLLEGTENVDLTDNGLGNALLVGNYGADQIAALGDYDTLVGATGANTLFYASLPAGAPGSSAGADVTVLGGGNDTIATNNDAADITTSDGHSEVFLGAPQTFAQGNNVVLNGADTVVCGGVGDVTDNITVNAAAGLGGNLVFGAANSQLNFVGGNTASTVVGAGGQIQMRGGSANGNVLWCGGAGEVSYVGQGGSAVIVAGSGQTFVQGGAGPVTVFGGTGEGNFSGSAGSVFVVGDGATTVQAATGVSVYVTGNANVSVAGGAGASVYGGTSTGDNVFQATAGNETLWGGLGSDLFLAGPGNALLVSGGGTDEFRFTAGLSGGSDTIAGFVPGQDTLELDGYGPTPPPITYAFGDSILNLSDGTQIVVYGVANLTVSSIVTG